MLPRIFALLAAGFLASTSIAHAAPKPDAAPRIATIPLVEIPGPKVRAKDVLGPSAPELDLGPTPAVGSSRLLERAELSRAFEAAGLPVPKTLPATVRIARKTKRLSATEVATAVRDSLGVTPLPRGAMLANVRANSVEVPADFQRVTVALPPLPRRAGLMTTQATVTFVGEGEAPVHKIFTPVDLTLPPEAAIAEIPRGSTLTLVVRHGLVEVSLPVVAAIDGDVGGVIPVTIKPSGRILRARVLDKDHAIAVEGS
jgi:hypothetical protein